MTTTYTNTACNSENIVACLVSGEGLLHACISSSSCDSVRLGPVIHGGVCTKGKSLLLLKKLLIQPQNISFCKKMTYVK